MALIKCPECQVDISDQAPVCPKCGFPFGKEPNPPEIAQKVIVDRLKIELTAEEFRHTISRFLFMSIFGMFLGMISFWGGIFMNAPGLAAAGVMIGGVLAIAGFIGLVITGWRQRRS